MRNFLFNSLLSIDNIFNSGTNTGAHVNDHGTPSDHKIEVNDLNEIIPGHIDKHCLGIKKHEFKYGKLVKQYGFNSTEIYDKNKISFEYIEKHIDSSTFGTGTEGPKSWNWGLISVNPSLDMDFVERHMNSSWNW